MFLQSIVIRALVITGGTLKVFNLIVDHTNMAVQVTICGACVIALRTLYVFNFIVDRLGMSVQMTFSRTLKFASGAMKSIQTIITAFSIFAFAVFGEEFK